VRPRVADLVTAFSLAGLLAGVGLTAPRWSRYFRQPLPATPEEPGAPAPAAATPAPEAQRTINVKLFFDAPDARGLVLEDRAVPFSSDIAAQIRTLVEELAKGSRIGLVATLPPATKVLEVFVTARGVAYVDLSKDARDGLSGGSDAEMRTVYSIVDSLTASFPSIARVQLLIENEAVSTLGGHVDLSRPLPPDMTLLSAAALAPTESPAPKRAEPIS
jgi:sporulation and spore germination protein